MSAGAAAARPAIHAPGFFELIQAIVGPLIDLPFFSLEPGTLLADLRLDDLDLATIAVELDEALGIEIPDREIEGWHTFNDIIATLKRLTATAARQPSGPRA